MLASTNRLSDLLILFLLLLSATTSAAPSTNQFHRRSTDVKISKTVQSRQTTSREILHRRNIKKRLEMARQVKEGCKPTQELRASGKPYPTCHAEGGKIGYARYANWDLYRDDLPGNPYHSTTQSEAICTQRCTDYVSPDGTDNCLGAVFSNHFCYLKGSNVCGGDFSNTSPGSQAAGAAINLIGDCAAWSGYVPPGMDAVCCNS